MRLEPTDKILELLRSAVEAEIDNQEVLRLASLAMQSGDLDRAQLSVMMSLSNDLNALNARLAALTIAVFGLEETAQNDLIPEPRPPLGFNIPDDLRGGSPST